GTVNATTSNIVASTRMDCFSMSFSSGCATASRGQIVSGSAGRRRCARGRRRIGTARFRTAVDQELADQVLDAHRRLRQHQLVAVLEERGRATRLDANILVTQ